MEWSTNLIKLSVIIPVYNRENTIKRCIQSIINQTKKVWEIIVVDDGSIDNTISILQSIECQYLKIIKQNHRGPQAARNLGILNSTGDYIAFLDSDDEWLPDFTDIVDSEIEINNSCVIYGDCITDKLGERKNWYLPGKSGNLYSFLLERPAPTFCALVAKKDYFIEIGLLDEKVKAYQEWDTSIRLARDHYFVHVKKPMFIYYLHNGETISNDKKKEIEGYYYIVNKHKNEIIKFCGLRILKKHYICLFRKAFQSKKSWRCFLFYVI